MNYPDQSDNPARQALTRAVDRAIANGSPVVVNVPIPEQSEPQRIARWESKGGKYWVDLYFNPCFHLANGTDVVDAHYRGDGCGGGVDGQTIEEAIASMQSRVDRGYFQADANKTPMHRVEIR
jgi:hypothetical protein